MGGPINTVDAAFRLDGRSLPGQHAYDLSRLLQAALPWLKEEPDAGIHPIHVAASGNGWLRPDGELQLSRRTRLTLRVLKKRVVDVQRLSGVTMGFGGYRLTLGKASLRPLSASGTLFSRYVVGAEQDTEEQFIAAVVGELKALGIVVKQLICGRSHQIDTPEEPFHTRSVLIAGLSPQKSLRLQQKGAGPGRQLGCGLFIPHKGIEAIGIANEGLGREVGRASERNR